MRRRLLTVAVLLLAVAPGCRHAAGPEAAPARPVVEEYGLPP